MVYRTVRIGRSKNFRKKILYPSGNCPCARFDDETLAKLKTERHVALIMRVRNQASAIEQGRRDDRAVTDPCTDKNPSLVVKRAKNV